MSDHRLDYQLDRTRRVLTKLQRRNVPVYSIEIGVRRSRPLIHTGAGPFDWHVVAFGHDEKGHWQEHIAHLDGVDLYRRLRPHRALGTAE